MFLTKILVGEILEGMKEVASLSQQIQKIAAILETLKLWTDSLKIVVIPLRGEGC